MVIIIVLLPLVTALSASLYSKAPCMALEVNRKRNPPQVDPPEMALRQCGFLGHKRSICRFRMLIVADNVPLQFLILLVTLDKW